MSGDTVVVGAISENGSGTGVNPVPDEATHDAGAAYVYVRSETGWSQQAYPKPSNAGIDDFFGYSVAVSGDTVVVGAYREDGNGTGVNPTTDELAGYAAGAAYVFVRSGTRWMQQAYLKASNTQVGDEFGFSVATSGDTVVVGAPGEDGRGTGVNPASDNLAADAGAAYVFTSLGPVPGPEMAVESSGVITDDGAITSFGAVYVGSTSAMTFTIRNSGDADLTSLAVAKDGTNAGDFMVSSEQHQRLCGGGYRNLHRDLQPRRGRPTQRGDSHREQCVRCGESLRHHAHRHRHRCNAADKHSPRIFLNFMPRKDGRQGQRQNEAVAGK